jgi:hypothetical protein
MNKKEATIKIERIWDDFVKSEKVILDTKGKELPNIDEARSNAIEDLKVIIKQFVVGDTNINEFKTNIDSYNKRNNLWGFTATKGQMFFNQLVKNNEDNLTKLTKLLKKVITEPDNLEEALSKIAELETHCNKIYQTAQDKRKVPNPGSVGYFLSYFWQIHNKDNWPVMYTSLIQAFDELNLWQEGGSQKENYKKFFTLNEEIKRILSEHANKKISNWEAEHAFWLFRGNPNKPILKRKKENSEYIASSSEKETKISLNASFELTDYLIPKVANLSELGSQKEKSASAKGSAYEKKVAEIFKLLDFDVEILGQGKGRNPDAILRFREENTAFIVDAKAYSNGYSLGIDDRAIKEYINHYCPKLQKNGFKKIGFIIVRNSFKSGLDPFINSITWETDIKRFILLTSEALLYLLAYKTKDTLNLTTIIERIIGFSNPVDAQQIIEEFDDV